ncbi:KGG domain-containing protein [Falsiroseomonas oryzae]|uniref:KGG domain-containing protein n=1 Tax=Falsiroseomonas oryzae TaxID=2766473 RepID=UPI0022EB47BC|nr:KGG domain-containing protein [Roseomonas sp. MO-31]
MAETDNRKEGGHSGGQHDSAEGVKGVEPETVGAGKEKDPNNFANDPERAREAGRKGGEARREKG